MRYFVEVGLGHTESCLGSSLGVGVGKQDVGGLLRGKCKAEKLFLCSPWTENQETWVPSGAPFLAGESLQVVAQLLPPALGPLCLCWWWCGCSWTPTAPGNRLPRNDWVVECVVSNTGDLLQSLCGFRGGLSRRLASWGSQFSAALQESQDSGQRA